MEESIQNSKNPDPIGMETLLTISKARHFNEWMYNTIQPFLQGEILEVGSGIGNISTFAIRDQLIITLSDINPEYQLLLKQKFGQIRHVRDILSIDLQHPDFKHQYINLKERYNTIFLLNVIEHLHNDVKAIDNCNYLLKKGGSLIVLAPAYPFLFCNFDKELGHYRRYTLRSLTSLFPPSSFRILKKQHFNAFGIVGWFWFGKILKRRQIRSSEMSIFEKLVPFLKIPDRLFFSKIGLSVIVIGNKK